MLFGDQIILKTTDILKQIAHLHNCFISRYVEMSLSSYVKEIKMKR